MRRPRGIAPVSTSVYLFSSASGRASGSGINVTNGIFFDHYTCMVVGLVI
jgi:hypothetical protein